MALYGSIDLQKRDEQNPNPYASQLMLCHVVLILLMALPLEPCHSESVFKVAMIEKKYGQKPNPSGSSN